MGLKYIPNSKGYVTDNFQLLNRLTVTKSGMKVMPLEATQMSHFFNYLLSAVTNMVDIGTCEVGMMLASCNVWS
jgi:hypothetical protein